MGWRRFVVFWKSAPNSPMPTRRLKRRIKPKPAPWWWWQPVGFFGGFDFFPFTTVVVFNHRNFFFKHHDHFFHHGNGRFFSRDGSGKGNFFGMSATTNPSVAGLRRGSIQSPSMLRVKRTSTGGSSVGL